MAKGVRTTIKLEGTRELVETLRTLRKSAAKKATRQAVNAGASPIVKAVKANAKKVKRTGLLAKSIKKKVKQYSDGNAIAIVGADRAIEATVTELGKGKNKRARQIGRVVPANYVHLVEGGTKPHSYKKRAGKHPGASAKPVIAPAVSSTRSQVGAIMERKLQETIEKEAAKAAAKGR